MKNMIQHSKFRNQSGYSIVEILIVLGLVGYGMYGSMTLADYLGSNQNTHRYLITSEALIDEIRRELGNNNSCLNSLGGITLNNSTNAPVNDIQNELNNPVFTAGQVYMDRGVMLRSIRARDYQDITIPRGKMILEVELEAPGKVVGARKIARTLQINTVKTGTTLTGCSSSLQGGEDPWRSTAGSDGIYVNQNVGIGTASPEVGLDVEGLIHGRFECRKIRGDVNINGFSETRCNADEWVMSGGGHCLSPLQFPTTGGFLSRSHPNADHSGWIMDCDSADPVPGVASVAEGFAWAMCCKR